MRRQDRVGVIIDLRVWRWINNKTEAKRDYSVSRAGDTKEGEENDDNPDWNESSSEHYRPPCFVVSTRSGSNARSG
jgi:hypothetical protein